MSDINLDIKNKIKKNKIISYINEAPENAYKRMMLAIVERDLEAIDIMIEHGINIDITTQVKGQDKLHTPLMLAATFGFTDVIDKLLYYGANPYNCDENGKDVLTYAKNHTSAHNKIIKHMANHAKESYTDKDFYDAPEIQ